MEKFFNFIQISVLNQVLCNTLITSRTVTLSFKILGISTADAPQPPVLLFHNIIGNKKQWEGIGKTLQNVTGLSVVAIDVRNHGDSPHLNSHRYIDQASDVLELFEKLGSQQASLIGHGTGGKTAMCVALMAPQKVAGLLVVDASPISTSMEYNKYLLKVLTSMKNINFKNAKSVSKARTEAKDKLLETVGNDFTMKAVLSNIRLKEDNTIGWSCNLHALIKQYKHWVSFPKKMKNRTYNGPTLFIGGQLSKYITPEDVNGIRALFPQAVIVYVPNAGHYVQVDDPKAFLEITISFLKTYTRDGPTIN